jgi:hypothetical protein
MVSSGRRAQVIGFALLLLATALPILLWHDVIADIARAFRPTPRYFLGWAPWALLAGGVAFFAPVAWSIGRRPDSRRYPRARNAYLGWALTLYLLGLALATQVANIHDGVFS